MTPKPLFCCVVGCGSRSEKHRNLSFFRIPAELKNKHQSHLNDLSKERRKKWIDSIKRKDFSESKAKWSRVCSKHFISNKPAELQDRDNPDWVPNINMGYQKTYREDLHRYDRRQKRVRVKETLSSEEVVPNLEEMVEEVEDNDLGKLCKNTQTDLKNNDLTDAFIKLAEFKNREQQFSKVLLNWESLRNDDRKTKYFTGLPNFKVFEIVVDSIKDYIPVHPNTALSAENQILLALMKLRLNLDFIYLGYRFGLSPSTVAKYFKTVIKVMCARFKNLVVWPDREALKKSMPPSFVESFATRVTIIIDCFEIPIQRPSELLAAAQSWSSYKHHQTTKYLIGVTPQGSICFISEGWGGRVSDKFLTENSSFTDHLLPNDLVLADRGFLIKDHLKIFNVTVKIPAFTKGKSQLHPVDLEETRSIAHVRIHVERVIGTIRQKFKILNQVAPMTLLTTGEEPILDEIVFVCCALINICPPIVPL